MEFDAQVLGTLVALSLIVERLVEFFVKRFFERYTLDTFWLIPITWVFSALVAAGTGLNLFEGVFMWPWVGIVLTSLVAGAGSNFMHELLAVMNGLKELLRSKA